MSIFNTFIPIIYKLRESSINLEDIEYNTDFSNDLCYPKLSNGYNHFAFQNMLKYIENVEKYKKIISNLITEPFNIYSIQPKDSKENISILDETNNFINKLDSKIPKIENNDFMKIWELILYFELISHKNKKFTSIHITDSYCEYIKPVIINRLNNNGDLKKDEFIILTEKEDKDDFIKHFKKNISINKKEEADLITIEIHNVIDLKELTEQYSYNTTLHDILNVLELQKNGGNLILKIFDTYTDISIYIIEFLKCFYEETYITKPFTSYVAYSEKFLICKNFNKSKVSKKIINGFKEIINMLDYNKNFKLSKLFDNIDIKEKSMKEYKKINIEMEVFKYNGLYNYMSYVALDNKNGVEYEEMVQKNKKASIFWNEIFLNKDNFDKIKYK